jgi:hypothetical protein
MNNAVKNQDFLLYENATCTCVTANIFFSVAWRQLRLKQGSHGGHVLTTKQKADHGSMLVKNYIRSDTNIFTRDFFLLVLIVVKLILKIKLPRCE